MNTSQVYIAISIVVFIFFALLVIFVRKNKKGSRLTPPASLSFGFVLAGILFSDERFIGYSLLGVGMILAVIDMIRGSKSK